MYSFDDEDPKFEWIIQLINELSLRMEIIERRQANDYPVAPYVDWYIDEEHEGDE